MNLPSEVAQTLHPNEMVRLHCHRWCPEAKTCTGLEAHLLRNLQLLEASRFGLALTHLGTAVAKQCLTSCDETSVPKLLGGSTAIGPKLPIR